MKKDKRRPSILSQVFILIAALALPISILFFFETSVSRSVILEQTENSLQTTAEISIDEIDRRIYLINNYFYDLPTADTHFAELIKQTPGAYHNMCRSNMINTLTTHINSVGDADIYYFYSSTLDEGGIAVGSSYPSSLKEALKADLFDEAYLNAHRKWSIVELDGKRWLFRDTYLYGEHYGALIDLDLLGQSLLDSVGYTTAEVEWSLTDPEEQMETMTTVNAASQRSRLQLLISVSDREIIQTLPLLQRIGYLLAVCNLILAAGIMLLMYQLVLKPLYQLNNALVGMKNGDADMRITEEGGSAEYQETFTHFNEMADRIHTLKIDNYEKEIERRDMEIKNLQLQIRPHFLLNTFNLLYSLVMIGESDSAAKLIMYLTDYFRYIFRSEKNLEKFSLEVDLIRKYVEVAQINYPGKLEIQYLITPEMNDILIPPLLVHNFIENSVRHGISQEKVLHITLGAFYEEGRVLIEIRDDGVGVPPEWVDRLNGLNDNTVQIQGRVGWKNSIRRLKHFYGDEAHVDLRSTEGVETVTRISFPYDKEQLEKKQGDQV